MILPGKVSDYGASLRLALQPKLKFIKSNITKSISQFKPFISVLK